MERLTNNIDFCQMHCDFGKTGGCFFKDKSHCYDNNIYNRLREYEIAEEQGLLLRLPCKVGDIIYEIEEDRLSSTMKTIEFEGQEYHRHIPHYFINMDAFAISKIDKVGKTVFLTKEEAEQALKQMGE